MHFTDSHAWILVQNDQAVVGITQYAKKELGEIVYIQLPPIGKHVKAGEEAAILESTKAASDIYTPLTGEVIEVNQKVLESPDLLNQSPEDQGWLFKVRISNPEEINLFMDRKTYQEMVELV